MTDKQLVVIIDRQVVGTISMDSKAHLRFVYDADWRAAEIAPPLSISLPLVSAEHDHARTEAFLWGLLPDNEIVLDRWARRFHVSPRNVFALLSHVGEECAGAAQFVRPERSGEILSQLDPDIEWLDESDIAARLKELRADHSAGRRSHDRGQFSLAGAQPKTALLKYDQRWGIPSGRTPTTHILKPATGELDGHVENEHFCLTLARGVGLPTASSEVHYFEDEVAIVVERYDRRIGDTVAESGASQLSILRVHQEDVCQALGVRPGLKYQSDGGPKPVDIAKLLRDHSNQPTEDVATFVDALAFNWLIAGTDAHAKNYSVLHGRGPRVRLAPLYDVASYLPYDEDPQRTKLAMKIGGQYRLRDIGRRQWEKLADELGLCADEALERLRRLALSIPERVHELRERMELDHPVLEVLATGIADRAQSCMKSF